MFLFREKRTQIVTKKYNNKYKKIINNKESLAQITTLLNLYNAK